MAGRKRKKMREKEKEKEIERERKIGRENPTLSAEAG